jgi:serralysin
MPIQFLDSGGQSFVLDSSHADVIDTSKSLTLTQSSTVEIFTSAQFTGVQLWAVDATNATLLSEGLPFTGTNLVTNGQFGLTTITLPAGTWFFGAVDTSVPAGQTTGAFVDATVISDPGATTAGNVPMAIYGNPGSWRSIGFDVTGSPQGFLQEEAVGGKTVVMTQAQFQTFEAHYATGYNGGAFDSVETLGGSATDPGAHQELTLAPGSYELVWINDTAGWSGGAANLSFFSGNGATGSVAINSNTDLVAKDMPSAVGDDLQANAQFTEVHAGFGNDTIQGAAVADILRGDQGDDSISGGAQFDDINGNMGNDTLHGNDGDDWVVGGKDNDVQFGDAGSDIVWGNLGNDTLDGGDGNDQVRGGQGDDILTGGAGNDFISGDRGNDTESGGAGADLFHGSQDAGIDKVLDFNLAEGDRVMLDPGTTFTVKQVGADTVIDMGPSPDGSPNEMILVGVQMSTLTGDWIFGF